MKFFHKCGTAVIVVQEDILWSAILREFANWVGDDKDYTKRYNSTLANNIVESAVYSSLSGPFSHVKHEDLEKIFLKEDVEIDLTALRGVDRANIMDRLRAVEDTIDMIAKYLKYEENRQRNKSA